MAHPWSSATTGTGAYWSWDLAGCGMSANTTGGTGDAACASSDLWPGAYDTRIISPVLDLSGYGNVVLSYRANYQHYANDTLDLDISANGGSTWVTLLRWQEDHEPFGNASGGLVSLDVTPYVSSQTLFRWRYYNLSEDAWDGYVQIDDILVSSLQEPSEVPEPSSLVTAAAGLGVLLLLASRR